MDDPDEEGRSDARALARGFAEAMEGDAPSPAQAGLFGGQIADADGVGARRGPGRPAGSRNRRSNEWRDYLLTRFQSPLIGMAEIASSDPLALARVLDVAPAAAVGMIQTAQRDLAPYLHEKRPQAFEGPTGAGFQIIIQTGESDGGAQTIEARPIQQDQGLSSEADAASESGASE